MAFEKSNLSESAKRLWEDVFSAGSRYDLAWIANENAFLKQNLQETFEAHSYGIVFSSLIFDACMSLLRTIDKTRRTASIPNFLRAAETSDVYETLIAEIATWPSHRNIDRDGLEKFLNIELNILKFDYFLLLCYERPLKVLRNRLLAHSGIPGPKGNLPKFSELCCSCRLAELCGDRIYLLCTGSERSLYESLEAHRKYAVYFWHALATGLASDSRLETIRDNYDDFA